MMTSDESSNVWETVCPACGYDLRGSILAGRSICPECGQQFDPTNPRSFHHSETIENAGFTAATLRRAGIGLYSIACALLFVVTFLWTTPSGAFVAAAGGCLATICALCSASLLVLARRSGVGERRGNVPWIAAALLTPLAWYVVLSPVLDQHAGAKEARRLAATKASIQELVGNIEALQRDQGHLPGDENELVTLLDEPLPESAWGDQIHYVRGDGTASEYRVFVRHVSWLDVLMFEYDSRLADQAVVVTHF